MQIFVLRSQHLSPYAGNLNYFICLKYHPMNCNISIKTQMCTRDVLSMHSPPRFLLNVL